MLIYLELFSRQTVFKYFFNIDLYLKLDIDSLARFKNFCLIFFDKWQNIRTNRINIIDFHLNNVICGKNNIVLIILNYKQSCFGVSSLKLKTLLTKFQISKYLWTHNVQVYFEYLQI